MMAGEGGGEMDFYTASMGNIAAMGELSLLPDDNPHITATASELNYHADFDSGFEDRNAFARVTMSVYLEEAGRLSQLGVLMVSHSPTGGTDGISFIYTDGISFIYRGGYGWYLIHLQGVLMVSHSPTGGTDGISFIYRGGTDGISFTYRGGTDGIPFIYRGTDGISFIYRGTKGFIQDEILSEGERYMSLLYTWRSCSLAIPAIKSHDQPNRMEIYQLTIDILEPEITKLRAFFTFQCSVEQLLHTLGQLINMFAVLDQLKNSKASVKNDYATYKRAAEILKCFNDVKRMEESQQLSMFLGTHNCILTTMKTAFQQVTGFQDILCEIVNICIHTYENNLYLTPAEKHSLVKIIGFSIFLIDSELVNINKLDGKRKFSLSKIDKIFKQLEVVPLFGDMMTKPFSYIEMSPNFDATRWPQCLSEQPSAQTQLIKQLPLVRAQYVQLVCELTLQCGATMELTKPQKGLVFYLLCHCAPVILGVVFQPPSGEKTKTPVKEKVPTGQEDLATYDLSLRLLQTLSAWTASITEMFSWKLLHPTDRKQNPECPEDAEEYERATRYNYSSEEKFAVIEVITKIKSLQELITKSQVRLGDTIKRHIYMTLQQFVQVDLREPLRKATKHRKEVIHSVLNGVRTTCSDIARGLNPSTDPLLMGKKDPGYTIEIPRKQVLASSTQMYLLRTMLASLIDKSRKSQRKELDSQHVQNIENFLRATHFWPSLIHFKRSLRECCDLSQLWYREFYLEITMGRRIQFPIEMSMPWILTKHILNTRDPTMIECILYPLDLYNDSAHYALHNFKKQYLYDEIEAEVNLCFDQLIYSLSEQVFEHYKMLAGSIHLGMGFKNLSRKQGLKVPHPRTVRYEPLFQQTHFQLLGRSVDLKHLLTQRINSAFMKALDLAISRFESSDITAIVDLEGLLEVNRLAHNLLSRHLPLVPFDALFREANHSVNVPCGRVTLYLFCEISYNFLPQYCYNMATNRFVKTVFPFVDPVVRDKVPTAAPYYIWGSKALANCYSAIYGLYTNFVGQPHFQSMCRLLDYQDMAVVIRELLQLIKNMLDQILVPYLRTLKAVMPPRCILPRIEYGSPGVLSYYQAQLNDVMMYSDLQPKVFQCMREIGNAILFCRLLEQSLSITEVEDLCQSDMFQNIIPKPYVPLPDLPQGASTEGVDMRGLEEQRRVEQERELQAVLKRLQRDYRYQNLVPVISQHGTPQQEEIVKEFSTLTKERLCCGLSLFKVVLTKVKSFLDNKIWEGLPPANGIFDIDDSTEFHRLWSALQFIFCIPARSNEYTVDAVFDDGLNWVMFDEGLNCCVKAFVQGLFGEGLNWCGCTLMSLLGQQRRFEAMDFCYHLQKMHKIDQKSESVRGMSLTKMVDRIRKFQILNDQIFAIVNVHLYESASQAVIDPATVKHFDPPSPNTKFTLPETLSLQSDV
ncbi:hypothetical protein NP493_652g02000 [Ridgeia piscesae]|uniref:Uncharacterized protein n=1 Tax=Ridgeia piscesae TaxID=27915 RepID=A0AAD9NQ78_RIDPI|nr:hypothetical protein NP493_652g02000 [Ridgeia piscesae]